MALSYSCSHFHALGDEIWTDVAKIKEVTFWNFHGCGKSLDVVEINEYLASLNFLNGIHRTIA